MKKCLILNDTYYDFHHGCETVMNNINKLLEKNNFIVIATNPVGLNWKENKNFLDKINECDFIIVNGEGTIHHSKKRAKDLVSIAPYIKKRFNKPIFLINCTYQDNDGSIVEDIKYFDKIYVRESMSQKELLNKGIESIIVPDMTFYSTYDLNNKVITGNIGATDSVDDDISKKLFELCKKNNFQYLPALLTPNIKIFDKLSIYKTLKFYIRKILRLLQYKIYNRYDILLNGYNHYINQYDDYIQALANLKYLYVGRYHSLCFALKTLTPFVAFKSNSHKIESMLNDIGIKNRIIDIEELEINTFNEFTEEEKENIKAYINKAPLQIEKMFEEIKSCVERNKYE